MRILPRVLTPAALLAILLAAATEGVTDPTRGDSDLTTPFLTSDGRLSSIVRPEFRDAPGLLEDLDHFGIEGLEVALVGPLVFGPDPKQPPIPSRLLLRGVPKVVTRAREVLTYLDVPVPSVMVSLLATEVLCGDHGESGGHFGYTRDVPKGGNTLFRGIYSEFEPDSYLRSSLVATRPFQGTSLEFSNLGSSILENGAFEFIFRLFEEETRSEVLAWPTIVCTEGLPGIVATSEARTHLVIQPNTNPDAISTSTQPVETGVTFTVVPLSVGTDAAVLDLTADLRFVLPEPSDGLSTGEVSRNVHRVTTQFTIRDQETLLIGGLTIRRRMKSKRGLPVLSTVPVFGERTKSFETSELVIMVRARVLYGGRTGSIVLPPGEARRLDALKASDTTKRLEEGKGFCPPGPGVLVPGRPETR